MGSQFALKATGVSKRYPGVVALDQVDCTVLSGETHVLFGENGAGKSTLISIMAGANAPDAGQLSLADRDVALHSVSDARRLGISAVFQEFSLAPTLSVAENIVLGDAPTRFRTLDRGEMQRVAAARLKEFGFDIDPRAIVETLSRAEQQMVEISKAFRAELRVLILDEPTASLNDTECERLYSLIAQVKERGVGVIYVTHRMAEIERLADRITVLRDGRHVSTVPGGTSTDELIRLMSGRVMDQIYPPLPQPEPEIVFEARAVSTRDPKALDVSFHVRRGEIVGFAGLMGSGKSHAIRACAGLEPIRTGSVTLDGRDLSGASAAKCLGAGIVYLPPDRKAEGLLLNRPLRESVSLPWLRTKRLSRFMVLRRRTERRAVAALLKTLNLNPPNTERLAEAYSGGNQQKALLGRALMDKCVALFLDEPTVGVDMNSRIFIYQRINELASSGTAVVLVSSDLPEVLHLCNRVYVFSQGRVVAELSGSEIQEQNILQHMMHWDDDLEAAS
jgi:ribose transport system ATP-binding protein